jgi:hypothetical protein
MEAKNASEHCNNNKIALQRIDNMRMSSRLTMTSTVKGYAQAYENNNSKAYALLWERCNKAMKNKIEARSNYNRIEDNPITLLMAIKEHALNFQENRYSMSIILDAMRTFLFTKQKEGESLQDYTKRFRVA